MRNYVKKVAFWCFARCGHGSCVPTLRRFSAPFGVVLRESEELMSELIWKIKQLFRKVIPIALIAGVCYGGFTAYKRGWFGRKVTYQINSLVSKVPFFGSKFTSVSSHNSYRGAQRVSKATFKKAHRRSHGRRHHGRRARRHRR